MRWIDCTLTHQNQMMKPILFAVTATMFIAAPALADADLAKARNCLGCHAVDTKRVGPSYKDVAKKYAGQKDALDKLAVKIRQGGSGVWGVTFMPANAQVSEAEAKKLAAWILGS
jgi:cytochrome c